MNIWEKLPDLIFEHIECFPEYKRMLDFLSSNADENLPNILLYGSKGFPKEDLWYCIARTIFGNFQKKECIWNKEWVYTTSAHFLEIDLKHPNQPKDMSSLSDFLKEVIVYSPFHTKRHIIVLKNIDFMCIRGYVAILRVLLERFSHNAWFICTTDHIGKIEPPVRSRFMMKRVALPSSEEIENFLKRIGRAPIPYIQDGPHANHLYFHIFMSELISHNPQCDIHVLCKYFAPFIHDFFHDQNTLTMDQIRSLTQKLCIHSFSFAEFAMDMLHHISPDKHHEWIKNVCEIDHMCAQTDGYRKPLYVEYLLHVATYGNVISNKK